MVDFLVEKYIRWATQIMLGVNKKAIGDANDLIPCLHEKVARFSNSNTSSVAAVADLSQLKMKKNESWPKAD